MQQLMMSICGSLRLFQGSQQNDHKKFLRPSARASILTTAGRCEPARTRTAHGIECLLVMGKDGLNANGTAKVLGGAGAQCFDS
jgi:hypothetical protein